MASATQSTINKVTVGLFGAAAGGYMNDLANYYFANGNSELKLVEALVNSSSYKLSVANWPALNTAAQAAAIVGTLMNTTTGDAYTQGVAAAKAALDGGMSYANVASSSIIFLSTTTDAVYATAKAAFATRTGNADAYTDSGKLSLNLTELKSAVNPVSGEAGVGTVLTTAQDVLNGTTGNDTFRAVAGVVVGAQDQTTLNSSDIIDGLGGTDSIVVNMTGAVYAGGARLKGIENLQIGTDLVSAVDGTVTAAFDYNVNMGVNEITDVTTIRYDQINGTAGGTEEFLQVNNILMTGTALPTVLWKNEAGSTAGSIGVNYRASGVAGTTNQAIQLDNVSAPINDVTKGNMFIGAGVETFTITSIGSGTNTLHNATGSVPTGGVAVDLISGTGNTNLTKVVVDGAAAFGKAATVVTNTANGSYGLTNRAVADDLGLDNGTADGSTVVRGAASNLVSVATSVTEYDATNATGAQNMRFTALASGAATNVTFKGGSANDYAEFELGNINATGGAGNDTFAFINASSNSTFGEGDTMAGGDGADTIQIAVNGVGTYNISETELRNKTSFGTLDLRGATVNLTLSSDFVANADTANSITVRTDKVVQTSDTDTLNSSTVPTNNGLENDATNTVNLTMLSSNQSVSFLGGSGSDRVILNDATFNVLKSIDGGVYTDATLRAAGSNRYDTITVVTNGENVVIDAQDLSNVKNVEGFVLTKNSAAATYNITLTQAFLTANTQATDNATNTAILDNIFQIGTSSAANNRALAAGDVVNIDVSNLLATSNAALATGWSGARKFDITALENAGVTVNFIGNGGTAVTALTLRGLNTMLATNGQDANFADIVVSSAAIPGTTALYYQGGAADETVTLAAAANSVDMGAGNDTVTVPAAMAATGTLAGGAGAADTLVLGAAATINGATVSGFEVVTLAGAATMTVAQYNAFTTGATAGSGADNLTLSDAGTITADADVETYTLAAGTNQVTLAGATAQTVTGNTGADTVVTSAANSANKTITLGTGTDVLTISSAFAADWTLAAAGAAGAAVTGVETVNLQAGTGNNGGAAFTMFNGAATLNLTTVAGDAAAFVVLGTGGQTVNVSGNTAGTYTITDAAGSDAVDLTNVGAAGGAITVDVATSATSSLVTNFTTITGFRAGAGADIIDTTTGITGALTGLTIASADTGTLAAAFATAINANAAVTAANYNANGDAYLLTVSAGTAAGTYLVVNEGATNATYTSTEDVVIKLVGMTGTIVAADVV